MRPRASIGKAGCRVRDGRISLEEMQCASSGGGQGDILKLCLAFPGESDRPKELIAKADTKTIYSVFKRQKK